MEDLNTSNTIARSSASGPVVRHEYQRVPEDISVNYEVNTIADEGVLSTIPTVANFDPKIIGKPGLFKGDEGTWMEWSFAVRSYFHLTGWISDSILMNAEIRKEPILLDEIPEQKRTSSDMMYHYHTNLRSRRAQAYVRVVPRGNGLEAWRRLVQPFEHDDIDSSFDLYQAILNYTFSSDLANIEDQLTDLDLLVQTYEERSQDLIADHVLRGIIMNGVPEPLRTHLRVCSAQYGTSRTIRIAVREYVAAQGKKVHLPLTATAWTTTLMECDILQLGRTKGKG